MDAIRAAHPLAPIINAAFDRGLSYADLTAMLSPPSTQRARPGLEPSTDRLWSDLVFLYELGIEQAADPETGRRLMVELAQLCLHQLGDRDAAEHHLVRALATDPAHSEALELRLAMLIEEERFDEAAELLEAAVAAAAQDDRADLLVELAGIAYLHLEQTDRAVAALLAAHEHDHSRIDVLARARVMLIEQERWLEVKRVLDEETAHVLAWGGEQDDAALHALSESYRLLGERASCLRPKLAEECFRRAGFFGDADAMEKSTLLASLSERWPAEAARCRREGFEMRDRATAAMLHLRAAGLSLDYGLDFEAAEISIERSWLLDAGKLEAVDLIERVYEIQKRTRELPAKLAWMAKMTKDRADKVRILLRAARIAERFGDALSWYRRVLDVSPTNEDALARVDRILAHRGRHDVRAEIFEARLEHAAGRQEMRIRLELARIHTENLGDYDGAEEHLARVLTLDPASFPAASMLRAIYRDRGENEKVEGLLEVLIEYCPDRKSRRELLAEQGVRGRRFRKCRPRRARRTRSQSETSCMPSGRGDNLAMDGRKRRAEEERPVS
jgi:tetratricopeptide (TPR) repeat protein